MSTPQEEINSIVQEGLSTLAFNGFGLTSALVVEGDMIVELDNNSTPMSIEELQNRIFTDFDGRKYQMEANVRIELMVKRVGA